MYKCLIFSLIWYSAILGASLSKEADTDKDIHPLESGKYGSMNEAMHYKVVHDQQENGGMAGLITEAMDPLYERALAALCPYMDPDAKKPLSRADFYTLGGVVALSRMGGPKIVWSPGRKDLDLYDHECLCWRPHPELPPEGHLPAALLRDDDDKRASFEEGDHNKTAKHNAGVFNRMGLSYQEMVALVGAHSMGALHYEDSGFGDPAGENMWTVTSLKFSNQFFVNMLEPESGSWDRFDLPNGAHVYHSTQDADVVAMLPSDLGLMSIPETKKWVKKYAADEELFRKDFAAAYSKLLHLGVTRQKCPDPATLCHM